MESPETEVALLKALHVALLCQDFRNSWSFVHMGLMNEPIFELLVPKEVHDDKIPGPKICGRVVRSIPDQGPERTAAQPVVRSPL